MLTVPDDHAEQELLVITKLGAARDLASAVLCGRLDGTPRLLDALAGLVSACANHARLARS